jgi:biotin carboxyl carrier protein
VAASRRFTVRQGDATTPVEVFADGRVRVGEPGEVFAVTPTSPGHYVVTDGARAWRVAVAGPPDARWVGAEGTSACVAVEPEGQTHAPRKRALQGGLTAPMPGTVIDIEVTVGQRVRPGDVLLTLEAMKMELPIRAPREGLVSAIRCAPGELVQPGPPLVEIT